MAQTKGDRFTFTKDTVGTAKPKPGAKKSVEKARNTLNARYGNSSGGGKKK